MENVIPAKSIFNRKIVLEIKFKAKPAFIDKRGEILTKLIDNTTIPSVHWEIGSGDLKLRDNEDINETRSVIFLDPGKISVISSNVASNENFIHVVETVYKSIKEILGEFTMNRIGCRIIGTYKTQSTEYKQVLSGFKNMFPSQILLEDFNVKDLRFQLVYQNGQYHIGPVNKNDNFLHREFNYSGAVNAVGFAIDTDNYILKAADEKIKESNIKDVFMTSLSVEKSIFDKLSIL